jgi:hypothetical protein
MLGEIVFKQSVKFESGLDKEFINLEYVPSGPYNGNEIYSHKLVEL